MSPLHNAGHWTSRFCIIGGGIAGLLLAQRLASKGFTVTVLEGGGLELESPSQNLFQAEMAGTTHQGTLVGRYRTFGGSSIRWGGQLLPFSEDIFTPVAGSPSVPWPIEASQLKPYYEDFERSMHVGTLPFTDSLLSSLGHAQVSFSSDIRLRFSKWMPFSKRNLAQTIGRECLSNPLIQLFTHANVCDLSAEGDRIAAARVLDYRGRSFHFRAEHFIIAAGTVESSRLMLASSGVPNDYDQVGRYFHDHLSVRAAVLPREARRQIFQRLGPFLVKGVMHSCKLEAVSELQRDEGLSAVMAHIVAEEPEDTGIAAVRNLLFSLQTGRFKQALTSNIFPMLRGAGDVFRLFWASKLRQRRAYGKKAIVGLNLDLEQAPTADNRIRLSRNKDSLGLRKAIVDWRIGSAEYETVSKFARIIKHRLESAGFAPFNWTPGLLEGTVPTLCDTFHPMGGLRMGVHPSNSVVDKHLKVHGLANLHIASCAAFLSGGSSNPTFTLIALSLKLADRLSGLN